MPRWRRDIVVTHQRSWLRVCTTFLRQRPDLVIFWTKLRTDWQPVFMVWSSESPLSTFPPFSAEFACYWYSLKIIYKLIIIKIIAKNVIENLWKHVKSANKSVFWRGLNGDALYLNKNEKQFSSEWQWKFYGENSKCRHSFPVTILFTFSTTCWWNKDYQFFYSAPQCSHCKRRTSYDTSVRLSVCPSVTRRYCVETTARSTVQFALSHSKMCLVL